jgi:hypothetical protein
METDKPHRRKGGFLATMKAVLWSFFGVRKRADYENDAASLNPIYVIVAGLIAAAIFIALIMVAVSFAVS